MPTISCECGSSIHLSEVPCPRGAVTMPEGAWDDVKSGLKKTVVEGGDWRQVRDELLGFRNGAIKSLYLCPDCGRLYLFDRSGSPAPLAVWALDDGDAEQLLSGRIESSAPLPPT